MKTQKPEKARVISLDDLAPRADVKGGSGVRVFGQDAVAHGEPAHAKRRAGPQAPNLRRKS